MACETEYGIIRGFKSVFILAERIDLKSRAGGSWARPGSGALKRGRWFLPFQYLSQPLPFHERKGGKSYRNDYIALLSTRFDYHVNIYYVLKPYSNPQNSFLQEEMLDFRESTLPERYKLDDSFNKWLLDACFKSKLIKPYCRSLDLSHSEANSDFNESN